MIKQQELIRRVTGKNRLSNIMLCCKIVFDLIPQVLLIHMIGLYFAAALTREQILWECGAMLICFIGKAVCAYSATWTAHKAAKRYPKYGVQKGWERVTAAKVEADGFVELTDEEAQQMGFPF